MKKIVSRTGVGTGSVTRHLECGHKWPELKGGKAHMAKLAMCPTCGPLKAASRAEKHNAKAALRDGVLLPNTLTTKSVHGTGKSMYRPLQANVTDKRCAFHPCIDRVGDNDWCFGCGYYVCARHHENVRATGDPHALEHHRNERRVFA